jgi:hypothetical protein
MRRDDPRVLGLAAALVELLGALGMEQQHEPPDELVPFPFGFERRAAQALVREGRLATTKIGRRTYARRSAVLALVGNPVEQTTGPGHGANDPAAAAREAYPSQRLRVLRGAR